MRARWPSQHNARTKLRALRQQRDPLASPHSAQTPQSAQGWRATTSSVLVPMEPVEPRTVSRCFFIGVVRLVSIMARGSVGSRGIHAVKHAAVSGQKATAVLDSGAALDERLHQVTRHAHGHHEQRRNHQQPPALLAPCGCKNWAPTPASGHPLPTQTKAITITPCQAAPHTFPALARTDRRVPACPW